MTIFITHAPQDEAAALSLEKFLERRGLFVEMEDGARGFRPLQFSDVVIVLHSKDVVFSPYRLRMEQRALDAWAEQKLIFVKLDHNFAPVGLRDLPFIDASFEQQRDLVAWAAVHNQILERNRPPAPPAAGPAPRAAPSPQAQSQYDDVAAGRSRAPAAPPTRASSGAVNIAGVIVGFLLIFAGLAAGALIGAIYLVNRIGPEPGGFSDLIAGLDAFGARYGLPAGVSAPIAFGLVAIALIAIVTTITRAVLGLISNKRREDEVVQEYEAESGGALSKRDEPLGEEAAAPDADEREAVFVSYARANAPIVMPVVEQVKAQGRKLWLDQGGIAAGDGWAGEIVRAIRTSEGVCVMCSGAAFESDHVKREVYLADRYKKRLVPVFIEAAEPPEDFEYFFAGVQHLKLYETPEGERAAALAKALGDEGD